ncbi:MAG: LysR family transcriptional regulator [Gemmataceae bacterium]
MAHPLPHLETLVLAAESGSFTQAARRLGLTQAAVSQRIAILEREVGVALFQRQSGRVVLTAAGHLLHDHATRILALHDQARAALAQGPVHITGELVLVASTLPGEHLLPGFLARFQKLYPDVQVRVRICDSENVFSDIEQGRGQLGLAGCRSSSAHLEHQPFARDQFRLVVPRDHPLSHCGRISLEKLRTIRIIMREPGSGSRRCLERTLADAGIVLADLVALEMNSSEAIKEAICQGMGGAFLSTRVVQSALDEGKLAALQVEGLPLERELFAVYDRRRALATTSRLFLDLIAPGPSEG